MKAVFIYRDGELVGNATGYTTEKGARKSLIGSDDWYKMMKPYKTFYKADEIPSEYKEMGIYEWDKYTNSWIFRREVWSRKVWNEYVKKHYQFVEKDYEIKRGTIYTEISEEELKERRQYWYSKWCNDQMKDSRELWYDLYKAYDNLIKRLGYEQDNGKTRLD